MLARSALVLVVAALVGAGGCAGRPRIEASPGRDPPKCTAPDVVDGDEVTPVALGDRIEGEIGGGDTYAFCMTAGDWLRFTFKQPETVQQPVLSIKKGSVEIAQNRFYVFEADSATQLFATSDAVFTMQLEPLSPDFVGTFALDLTRPGAGVVVDATSVEFGEQVYGTLDGAGDDVIALPAVTTPGVIGVQPAVAGFFGNGATLFPLVDVVDGGGAILARLDFAQSRRLEVPVDAGTYSLRVHGEPGERPFYALEDVSFTENVVAEEDDAKNDTMAGAQLLLLDEHERGHRAKTVAVHLSLGDVDNFIFAVGEQQVASFSCRAESAGSGARALQVDLKDGDGTLLQRAEEGPRDHVFVGGTRTFLDAADAEYRVHSGNYVGSVQAFDFDDDVAGRWALCTASALDN